MLFTEENSIEVFFTKLEVSFDRRGGSNTFIKIVKDFIQFDAEILKNTFLVDIVKVVIDPK